MKATLQARPRSAPVMTDTNNSTNTQTEAKDSDMAKTDVPDDIMVEIVGELFDQRNNTQE